MKQFRLVNNLAGWVVFLIASSVYIATAEPTASFWDCGEYISTAYKLQVGHPPGAPLFQLMGRFFSLFAFGDVTLVARMINIMSALLSGLTIMFLYWTIAALTGRIVAKDREMNAKDLWIVLGSGLTGALAYTFSDSFWFSAVEGEVYATSSFFTAFVFWAILRWERVADDPSSYRWIILIAFMMGLSVGVHLLNLLTIPAMTMLFYFRKFKGNTKGAFLAFGVSLLLLAAIMYVIIPQVVTLFARTELLFVNSYGLPFNSGTLFFAILVVAAISSGLWYTYSGSRTSALSALIAYGMLIILVIASGTTLWAVVIRILIAAGVSVLVYLGRNRREVIRVSLLCLSFILIGYSSFLVLVIRSNANTPINENAPRDAISLLAYLNREQYGDWPLLYGPYFNAPYDSKDPYIDGTPYYERNNRTGRYEVADDRKNTIPNYDRRFFTLFPRMWSSSQDIHARGYQSWGKISGTPVPVRGFNGQNEIVRKPTFGENLRFFFTYQLGHMYFRYFLWNFAGRQNDVQGYGGSLSGNWISGIPFLDKMRLGPQNELPEPLAKNKGRNKYYLLPLLLGILGFYIQLNRDGRGALVIGLLFIFTGIAINIYLNPVPYQPRERDYAYAASFYAFAVWIGLGVTGLYLFLKRFLKRQAVSAMIVSLLCLICVPGIMARENWDDHDRSGRYTALDMAANYLNSCAPGAILFTLGDNDTFPLWYAQEVEGIRTDVRVVNLSLLNTDWYIDQMRRKAYDSDPVPFSVSRDKYVQTKREYILVYDDTTLVKPDLYFDIRKLVQFATTDSPEVMLETIKGPLNYIPTHNFLLEVDTVEVLTNGTVPPSMQDSVIPYITWEYNDYGMQKSALMQLDLLGTFGWKRPVYFAITTGSEAYLGLENYLQLEGMAYRLVPYRCNSIDGQTGKVQTDIMYHNIMEKFRWGNMNHPDIYLDETNIRMVRNLRNIFGRLAQALAYEGRMKEAANVCDLCIEVMPDNVVPYDLMLIPVADVYYQAGQPGKGDSVVRRLADYSGQELNYYNQFAGADAAYLDSDRRQARQILLELKSMAERFNRSAVKVDIEKIINLYP